MVKPSDYLLAHAELEGQPFNDPPATVIEGGLHVRVTVEMLCELVPHLPRSPRAPMGTFWYVSGLNTAQVRDEMTAQHNLVADGMPVVLTHAQVCFGISDGELRQYAARGPVQGRAAIEAAVRERATAAVVSLKDYSPGCSDIHWIGPSRGPADMFDQPKEATDGSQATDPQTPAL